MSKKYKGKTCVYCGRLNASEVPDHVLAREFVLKRHRTGLPIVPACVVCNTEKSKLETALTALLPFGAQHADATENLSTMVPKRLRKNDAVRAQVVRGLENPQWVPGPSGLWQRTSIVVLDTKQLEDWISYLTVGLIWHHWRAIVAGEIDIEPMLLTSEGEKFYAPMFDLKAARRVPVTSIGGDALIYEGIADNSHPLGSLWRFAIYGGLQLGGTDPRERASTYYVTVLPRDQKQAA